MEPGGSDLSATVVVAEVLGESRFQQMQDAVSQLLEQADAAPASTVCLTQIPFPIKSTTAAAIDREVMSRIRPDPVEEWNYLTFSHADGSTYARANPWMHRHSSLDKQEWIVAFMMSESCARLTAWWLPQLWRAAELASGALQALDGWSILVAANCARSLLETAAYLNYEVPDLIKMWDDFKNKGQPTTDRINGFVEKMNLFITRLQFSTRLTEVSASYPEALSKNVMTYVNKMAKSRPDADVLGMYGWLCDAVHPSFGSMSVYRALATGDNANTHLLERYERRPLELIASTPQRTQPTIAQKAADAIILSVGLLQRNLAAARWVVEDIGLTADVKSTLQLDVTLAHSRPQRNDRCLCGSGRKFKKCVHNWGASGVPLLPEDGERPTG